MDGFSGYSIIIALIMTLIVVTFFTVTFYVFIQSIINYRKLTTNKEQKDEELESISQEEDAEAFAKKVFLFIIIFVFWFFVLFGKIY